MNKKNATKRWWTQMCIMYVTSRIILYVSYFLPKKQRKKTLIAFSSCFADGWDSRMEQKKILDSLKSDFNRQQQNEK